MVDNRKVTAEVLESELVFTASRSGGPGGQNVNKVNTKINLSFDVFNSNLLTEEERNKIIQKLSSHISKDGVLNISASEKRSQLQNKISAMEKLDKLLIKAFAKRKVRKATKPSKASVKTRLDSKKKHSEKKKERRKLE